VKEYTLETPRTKFSIVVTMSCKLILKALMQFRTPSIFHTEKFNPAIGLVAGQDESSHGPNWDLTDWSMASAPTAASNKLNVMSRLRVTMLRFPAADFCSSN
jgi:hypothetical protein